jgi:hypothetical protein
MPTCTTCVSPTAFAGTGCAPKPAGGNLAYLWYTPACNLASGAASLVDGYDTGVITDIELEAAAVFYKIGVIKDSLVITEPNEPVGGRWAVNVSFKISTRGSDTDLITAANEARAFAQMMASNSDQLVFIWTNRDGVRYVATGFERMEFNSESGAAQSDVPGTTFAFEALLAQKPYVLDTGYTIPE